MKTLCVKAAAAALIILAANGAAKAEILTWNCGAPASGSTPTNAIVATLNTATGVMTISGAGRMIDGETYDGRNALWGAYKDAIRYAVIGNGITYIGSYAFGKCEQLDSFSIAESVTTIGRAAFYQCSALTSLPLPSSIDTIGEWVFGYCHGLTSVALPEGVRAMKTAAFSDLQNLQSITLPSSMTFVGAQMFDNCPSLLSISCLAALPPTSIAYPYGSAITSKILRVPRGSVDTFSRAYWWKDYARIVSLDAAPSGSNNANLDSLFVIVECVATGDGWTHCGNDLRQNIALTPPFSPDITDYTAHPADNVNRVTTRAVAQDENAIVVAAANDYRSGLLRDNPTILVIPVIAQDLTTTKYYRVRVVSSNASLQLLSVWDDSPRTFKFNIDVNRTDTTFLSVPNSVASMFLNASPMTNPTITGAGVHLLAEGTNRFDVATTSSDGTAERRFPFAVTRASASAAEEQLAAARDSAGNLQTRLADCEAGNCSALQSQLMAAQAIVVALKTDSTIKKLQIENLQLQLAQCTPSAVASEVAALLNIYPNPTQNGVLVIEDADLQAGEKVEVYAIGGGLAGIYEIAGALTTINIGNLAAGTYIVKVGGRAAKVVKQ